MFNPYGGQPTQPGAPQQPTQPGGPMQMQPGFFQQANIGPAMGVYANTMEEVSKMPIPEDLDKITIEDVVKFVTSDELTDLFRATVDLFKFAGFNAEEVLKMLKRYAAAAKRTPEQFVKDVVELLSYYMSRGTTIQSRGVINSMSQGAADRVRVLVSIYRIQDNVAPTARGPNIVTLGRLMNTFPEIIGAKLVQLKIPIIGTPNLIPRALAFPGGASLIPSTNDWNWLFEFFLDWAVTFDRTVNRPRRQNAKVEFKPKESRENQRGWSELARQNSRLTDAQRVAFILKHCDDFTLGLEMDNKGNITKMNPDNFHPKGGKRPDVER